MVLPDVYRLPGVPDTFDGFLMAVQLWMGDDGFFIGQRPHTYTASSV